VWGPFHFFCSPTDEAHAKQLQLIDNFKVDISPAKNCNRFDKNNKNKEIFEKNTIKKNTQQDFYFILGRGEHSASLPRGKKSLRQGWPPLSDLNFCKLMLWLMS
jgi:hypothetical protein